MLTSMAHLASTYSNQGRWKEAEELQAPAISEDKLQEFVNSDVSPQMLQSTLAGGTFGDVRRLLDEHSTSVTEGDLIRPQELREHGYETEEIAQLLVTDQNDSPWIYFQPGKLPGKLLSRTIMKSFVFIRAGRKSIPSTTSMDKRYHRLSWSSDNESLTHIEEFKGRGQLCLSSSLNMKYGCQKM